jgi:hypothetical protein
MICADRADLYMNNGLRNSSYNYLNWVNEWTTFANVSAQYGIPVAHEV